MQLAGTATRWLCTDLQIGPCPILLCQALRIDFNRAAIGAGYSNLNGGTWGISGNFLTQTAKGSLAFYIDYENTLTTASDYTAEYNLKEVSKGTLGPKAGAVYGYVDASNYGVADIKWQFQSA